MRQLICLLTTLLLVSCSNVQPVAMISRPITVTPINEQRSHRFDMIRSVILLGIYSSGQKSPHVTGSAVLISEKYNSNKKYTYVFLTVAHVVRMAQNIDLFKILIPEIDNTGNFVQILEIPKEADDDSIKYITVKDTDIAWLILETSTKLPVTTAQLPSVDQLNNIIIGDELFSVGCFSSLPPILSHGYLSLKDIYLGPIDSRNFKINTVSIPFDPGASGGAVFTKDGYLAGIITGSINHVGLYISIKYYLNAIIRSQETMDAIYTVKKKPVFF